MAAARGTHPCTHTHPQRTHASSLGELPDLLRDEFLVHFDNLLWDKLFARRQSSCVALTAPLSHKWYLKSRKQMRAKAPFKVHLRCLKSIYTHILLRSLLYELLMNSTFCYPTFLIHRGKKKQTRKPMQAVRKQMHHSKAGEALEAAEQQGTFAKRGTGGKEQKARICEMPVLTDSRRAYIRDFVSYRASTASHGQASRPPHQGRCLARGRPQRLAAPRANTKLQAFFWWGSDKPRPSRARCYSSGGRRSFSWNSSALLVNEAAALSVHGS